MRAKAGVDASNLVLIGSLFRLGYRARDRLVTAILWDHWGVYEDMVYPASNLGAHWRLALAPGNPGKIRK